MEPIEATGPRAHREFRSAVGARVVVRAITAADGDGLQGLYERLPPDDVRLRFFASRWNDELPDREAQVGGRGGVGLVAVDDDGAIVGHAEYTPLPNGNGEFAVAVDPAWRGGLGRFLIDALAGEAAEHGVANLEGDVMAVNRPMMALARTRGFALIPVEDRTTFRVVLGAAERWPGWAPDDQRPRLLVEGSHSHLNNFVDVDAEGWQVVVCPGPVPSRRPSCPLLGGETCPLVRDADMIICAVPHDRGDALLAVHRRLSSDIPVVDDRR